MSGFIRVGLALVGGSFLLTALALPTSSSDAVTLQSGGVVRGKIAILGKKVAITTRSGARVVIDRSSVAAVHRESSAPSSASHQPKLTNAQKAWLPKVHKLVNQANNAEANGSARALRDLRSISDPDAIPAFSQYLRTSNLDSMRLLYVRILGDMPGSQPVVFLIEEALFDSSPMVREAAQETTKKQPPRRVRPYYDQALRFPSREVVCRAASVLTTVGDKENVPALIDSLYSPTVETVVRPSCCMSRVAYLAPSTRAHSNGYGAVRNLYGGGVPGELEAVTVVRNAANPQARDALEAITKRSFGYDTDAWRRWWRSEQLVEAKREAAANDRISLER